MRVLLTGSAGFVGRHFDAVLSARGDDIRRVDPRNTEVPTDCRDFFRYNDEHYDLVIHLAAVVGGRAMIDGDPLAVAQNLAIDSDMFRWALRTHPGRVVYFSSSAVYPVYMQTADRSVRLCEADVDLRPGVYGFGMPDQTYGWAKLTGEMLAAHARAEGVPVSIFRPFSGYGSDQSYSYPFPKFIDRALTKQDPFEIWGDGQQIRDWIHIDDIVAAVLAGIEQDVEVANLCTGIPTRFDELAALVTTTRGYHPEFKHLTARPSGVSNRVGDPTIMERFYAPKISLAEGVQRAIYEGR